MTSKELLTIYNAPGVFTTDLARTRPWPKDLLKDKFDGAGTRDNLNKVTESDMYFLPGSWDFKRDKSYEADRAWHMAHGARDAIELGTGKVDKYNKMNSYYGWQNMFSSIAHSTGRGNEKDSVKYPSSDPDGRNVGNYQYYTNNMEGREQGVTIGHNDVGFCRNGTARWVSPIGLQFKWSNIHAKQQGARMRINQLYLIFTDIWVPSRALYAPIVRDGKFTNDKSFTRGVNILGPEGSTDWDLLAEPHYSGELIGFVDEDSMDVIKDRYTLSACIGIHHRDLNKGGSNAEKWKEWWDVQFLYNDDFNLSEIVIPEPFLLKDKLDDRKIKLL